MYDLVVVDGDLPWFEDQWHGSVFAKLTAFAFQEEDRVGFFRIQPGMLHEPGLV